MRIYVTLRGYARMADTARDENKAPEGVVEASSNDTPWIRRVVSAMRAPAPATPPETVMASALAAFREKRRHPDRTVHVARVLFDSWINLAPSAVRGDLPTADGPGEASASRHQVYSTAWHDVDLWGERLSEDLWYLIGQVLPKSGGQAIRALEALLVSPERAVKTGVPENGEFHIPSVQSGTYDLRLRLERAEVLLPNVRVGV